MKDFFLVILGAVLVIVGNWVRGRWELKGKREEMEKTHRRDAASAALKIMEIAPSDHEKRNKYVGHYGIVYEKLLRILREPEEKKKKE